MGTNLLQDDNRGFEDHVDLEGQRRGTRSFVLE